MKPLILTLVVIGVVYALVTVRAVQGNQEKPSVDSLVKLRDQFFPAPALKVNDITASCLQSGVITVPLGQTCIVVVQRSNERVREARLSIPAGSRAQVTLAQSGQLSAKRELGKNGTRFEVDVFDKGGTLTVTCIAVNPCRIRLE